MENCLTPERRQVSVCAVRGVAESLLVRLQQAGQGPGVLESFRQRGGGLKPWPRRREEGRRGQPIGCNTPVAIGFSIMANFSMTSFVSPFGSSPMSAQC